MMDPETETEDRKPPVLLEPRENESLDRLWAGTMSRRTETRVPLFKSEYHHHYVEHGQHRYSVSKGVAVKQQRQLLPNPKPRLLKVRKMEEEEPQPQEDTASDSQSQEAPLLEIGDQPSRDFLELFTKLDSTISGELIEKAWKQYDTIGQQIVLEGNQHVWMACAFFTSVWQASPMAQPQSHQPQNHHQPQHQQELVVCRFSLSKLLQLCQCSVLDFFDRLNKWADMCLAQRRLLDHVARVQASLAVAAVCFKKFLPIFRRIFAHVPPAGSDRPQRQSPKKAAAAVKYENSQLQRLSSAQLFEFVWLMFIGLRKQLPPSQEDLLHSFHLLLCVLDYVYTAVAQAALHKHLAPEFAHQLAQEEQRPLELLCQLFDGVTLDAKHLRVHWLVPKLHRLAEEDGTIVGHGSPLGVGEVLNALETNRQAFEQMYEQRMLNRSEVDERIFLRQLLPSIDMLFGGTFDENAVAVLREFGEKGKHIGAELLLKVSTQSCLEKVAAARKAGRPPQQPITGKCYVITPETVCPNAAASLSPEQRQSERMSRLLMEWQQAESVLDFFFEECQPENPRDFVAEQLASFVQKFVLKMDEELLDLDKGPDFDADFERDITARIAEMESLFYCLLQKVVVYDRERAAGLGLAMPVDMGAIFHNVDFLAALFICAADLICWAHGSQRRFPWAAQLFAGSPAPLNFFRIFELVVRADVGLSVEMVRHLNQAEECVLEELAWTPDSPIWRALEDASSRAMDQFGGEKSPVPGSQQLFGRSLAAANAQQQRHADLLPPPIIGFFKKVYHLAIIRLTDLCERVRITEELTRQKIWTLFEHIFRTQTQQLLRGRHLDQLLMCSLYIVAKVCGLGLTFQDIIYHYRHQPQATGRVYRKVLMEEAEEEEDPQTVSKATPKSGKQQLQHDADLIKFYNQIFVPRVEDFVKLLHPSGPDSKENLVPLSPLPKVPLNPLSPRKLVSDRINVVPLSQYGQQQQQMMKSSASQQQQQQPRASMSTTPTAAATTIGGTGSAAAAATIGMPMGMGGRRYEFHKSPSKDLRSINQMVRGTAMASSSSTGSGGTSHPHQQSAASLFYQQQQQSNSNGGGRMY